MTHHQDCGWHVDQYPHECTCGAITGADLLRAQLMGTPLPDQLPPADWQSLMRERAPTFNRRPAMPDHQPQAHAQFKRRPLPEGDRRPSALPNWPPPGYHQLPDGERCRCIGLASRGGEHWCCGKGRKA